jgi:uncharacterized repeat protein (TIGR01451 family)
MNVATVRLAVRAALLMVASVAAASTAAATIGVAKTATVSGRQVTFDVYLENLGAAELTDVAVSDDLDAVFGAGNYSLTSGPAFVDNPGTLTLNGSFDGSGDPVLVSSGTLAAGDTARIQMSVEVTAVSDQGSGFGVYFNQATATALDGASPVQDLSDDGTDPDPSGNGDPGDAGEDDPTLVDVSAAPMIGVAKRAKLDGTQVTFDLVIENLGNRELLGIDLTDDLDQTFGAGNYSVISGPALIDDPGTITVNGAFDGGGDTHLISSGSLATASSARIRIVVDVTTVVDLGAGFGVYANQATVTGALTDGRTVSDLSDDGVDPDPDGDGNPTGDREDDPTVVVIGEEPVVGVAKAVSVAGSVATIDLVLENLGNVTLDGFELQEALNPVFGAGTFFVSAGPSFVIDPGTMTLNPAYDGNTDTSLVSTGDLAPGAVAAIRIEVTVIEVADLGLGLGMYSNQATVAVSGPGGGLALDWSDDGTDPDPDGDGEPDEDGENDPTGFTVAPVSSIGIAKRYVSGGEISGDPLVILEFTIVNTGNQPISSLSVADDLNAVYGAGNFFHLQDPVYVDGSPTLSYNAAFNGSTNTAMLNGGTLAPGESTTFRTAARITNITDQGFGLGIYQNLVTVNGLDPDANPVSDLSDEGSVPDGNGNGDPTDDSDPTVIDVNQRAVIGAAKDASVANDEVTVDLYLENLGTLPLDSVVLEENLATTFGAGTFAVIVPPFLVDDPGTLTLNPGWDGEASVEMLDVGSSSLAAGDTAQIRFVAQVLEVSNQGLGLGNYGNQVRAAAISSLGEVVSDLSDDGTDPDPNGNGDPSEPGENDPTPISLASDTVVGVAKTVVVTDHQVTVDIYLESLGSETASPLELTDDLDATFGAGNYILTTPPALIVDPGTLVLDSAYDGSANTGILAAGSSLASSATAQIQLVVEVTTESDQGFGYGAYQNQAVARATSPAGLVITDLSDDGTDPDPNGNSDPGEAGEDDPTAIVIGGSPVIGIAKKAYVNGTAVIFEFAIENLGDVTLSNVVLRDSLNPVFGSGNYSIISQPSQVAGPGTLALSSQFFGFSVFDGVVLGGFLRPGETEVVRTIVNITNVTDQGNGFGVYFNGVTVTAAGPDGTSVMDLSDDGVNPDPNGNGNPGDMGEDDPTQIIIGDEAILGVAKDASVSGQQVTFDIYLENFGASNLASLSVVEDLDGVFGAGNYSLNGSPTLISDPGTIVLNGAFDGSGDQELIAMGSTLAAFGTAQIRLVVDVTTVTDQGQGLGLYSNQVLASGSAPLGTFTSDLSDDGIDPDPNGNGLPNDGGEDDPTTFGVTTVIVGAAKQATVVGRTVTFTCAIERLGSANLDTLSVTEDLDAVFGADYYQVVSGPEILGDPHDLIANASFDGSVDTEMIASGGLQGLVEIRLVVEVTTVTDQGMGTGIYANQVTASATGVGGGMWSDLSDDGTDPDPDGDLDPGGPGEDDPTVFALGGFIDGLVWNDRDGSVSQEAGEPGLDGVVVYVDLDSSGSLDEGEPNDLTDTDGHYELVVASPGTYSVNVDPASLPTGFASTTGNVPFAATVAAGGNVTADPFGYRAVADLTSAVTGSASPAVAGTPLTYTVNVGNVGPSTVPDVVLYQLLPDDVSYQSDTASCTEPPQLTALRASLDPGNEVPPAMSELSGSAGFVLDTATLQLHFAVHVVGAAEITAVHIHSGAAGVNGGVVHTLYAGAPLFDETHPITGTLQLDATQATDLLTMPLYVNVHTTSFPGGEIRGQLEVTEQPVLTCAIGDLGIGSPFSVDVSVGVASSAPQGSILDSIAIATTSAQDPDEAPLPAGRVAGTTSRLATAVVSEADLAIAKVDETDPVVAGTSEVYTVTVTNAGPSDAADVVVTETLPMGLTLTSTTGCAEDPGGAPTCSLGLVPTGGEASFTVTVDVDPAARGTLTNSVSVATSSTDPNLADNSADEDTTVSALVDLVLVKDVAPEPAVSGMPLVYTLTVTNNGPSAATDVAVVDTLPGGLVNPATAGCAEDPAGTPTCSLGTVMPGAFAQYTITVDIAPSPPPAVTNTATASSVEPDSNAADNTDTAMSTLDTTPPTVTRVDPVPAVGGDGIDDCDELHGPLASLVVTFSEEMADPAGDTDPDDVTNPANYLVVGAGPDGEFSTATCGAAVGDDILVSVATVTYDAMASTAELDLATVSSSQVQLMACGSTSLVDLVGNPLDGDGNGSGGDDFAVTFRYDPENLLTNAHFDCDAVGLGGWTLSDPVEITRSTDDADGSSISGSVQVMQLAANTTFELSQCVPSSGAAAHALGGRLRLTTASLLSVARGCEFFSDATCGLGGGTSLGTSANIEVGGDTAGQWVSLSGEVISPPGTGSARCTFTLTADSGQAFTAWLDALFFRPSALIFADDFESGNLSAWTGIVP